MGKKTGLSYKEWQEQIVKKLVDAGFPLNKAQKIAKNYTGLYREDVPADPQDVFVMAFKKNCVYVLGVDAESAMDDFIKDNALSIKNPLKDHHAIDYTREDKRISGDVQD